MINNNTTITGEILVQLGFKHFGNRTQYKSGKLIGEFYHKRRLIIGVMAKGGCEWEYLLEDFYGEKKKIIVKFDKIEKLKMIHFIVLGKELNTNGKR